MVARYSATCIAFFLGGVGLRSFLYLPLRASLLALGVFGGFLLVLCVAEKDKRSNAGILVFCACLSFALGTARFSFFEIRAETDILHLRYGETAVLRGTVIGFEEKQASARITVKTDQGKLLAISRPHPRYRYGDVIELTGVIGEPQPYLDFDTKAALAKDSIFSQMLFPEITTVDFSPPSRIMRALFVVKDSFETSIKTILPEPHASLAAGMLLGNEGVVEKDLLDAFRKSGTIHILVLSGYNITIVASAVLSVLSFFIRRSFALLGSTAAIVLFTLMAGGSAAAVRAAIMALIGMLALRTGRQTVALQSLLVAAFLMVLWNPFLLRFDRGFQLSFLATLGLIVASPLFLKLFRFLPRFLGIRESAAASAAAQIFVLPLLLSWGGEITFLSPFANVLVVGVVPAVMFFGFAGGVLGFLWTAAGQWIASVAYVLISFQIAIAKYFAGFAATLVSVNHLPLYLLIISYTLLLYWTIRVYEKIS